MFADLADLLVPAECPGCGRSADRRVPCLRCRRALAVAPERITPQVPVAAPVWSCGAYTEVRRRLVLEAKERGNPVARRIIGNVFAAALLRLGAEGRIADPRLGVTAIIPAPTRDISSRRRGGDPVMSACVTVGKHLESVTAIQAVRTLPQVKDSAGLGAAARRQNLAGKIVPVDGVVRGKYDNAVLVDDVLTTGATASGSVLVLASTGLNVGCVLVFSHA